jgi:hypothetical protein
MHNSLNWTSKPLTGTFMARLRYSRYNQSISLAMLIKSTVGPFIEESVRTIAMRRWKLMLQDEAEVCRWDGMGLGEQRERARGGRHFWVHGVQASIHM